ncbi:MAG TPA: hypothetical protein VNA13_03250 [Xanthomonadales bacterium]|nr:hypothetical protein [Xanthomonadales bacterium]
MNKRLFLLIPVVIFLSVAIALGGISLFKKYTTPKHAHYHAGFQVYVDGKLQDFSKAQFMKENPCTADGKSHGEEDEQLEKAHLHDRVGNVVHSHRESVYWKDLFTNIRYSLSRNKPIQSFINGKGVKDILEEKIIPYDSVVIFIGNNENTDELLKKAVKKEEIIKAENKSENCGS